MGAITVNSSRRDPVERVLEETDRLGADLVIDAAGAPEAMEESMEMVREKGQITRVGLDPDPMDFSLDPIVRKSVRLQGSKGHNYQIFEKAIQLIEGRQIKVAPLISKTYPLTDWERAFTDMETRKNIKSVIHP